MCVFGGRGLNVSVTVVWVSRYWCGCECGVGMGLGVWGVGVSNSMGVMCSCV